MSSTATLIPRPSEVEVSLPRQRTFISEYRAAIRAECDEASAPGVIGVNALDQGLAVAKSTQRAETLASWCNFQTRCERGTHNEGEGNAGTNPEDPLGDTSGKGVLSPVVAAPITVEGNRSSWGASSWQTWEGLRGSVMTCTQGFHPGEHERDEHISKGIDRVMDDEIKPRTLKALGVTPSDPSCIT